MEYITETRGGWDEWSDRYELICGLRFSDGTEIPSTRIEQFTDQDGNKIVIELPHRDRISNSIRVERTEPSYEYIPVSSLSELETAIKDNTTIDINQL
jgi:hypothetical protein